MTTTNSGGTLLDPHIAPHWQSSALVTIDMQRDFLSGRPHGLAGTTEIIPGLRRLAEAFRAAGRPTFHMVRLYEADGGNADRARRGLLASGASVVRPGTPGRLLAPGLAPEDDVELDDVELLAGKSQQLGPAEYVVFKPRWGAFYQTPLDGLLVEREVDTIVIAGCNLPNCPRASMVEASERDYRVVLAMDAISQASEQGFREIASIGAVLLAVDEIAAGVATNTGT